MGIQYSKKSGLAVQPLQPVVASRRRPGRHATAYGRVVTASFRFVGTRIQTANDNAAWYRDNHFEDHLIDSLVLIYVWVHTLILGTVVMEDMEVAAPAPAPAPIPIAAPVPQTLGARGATPTHYRAFSLLQTRVAGVQASAALFAFRERVKTIKLEDSEVVRNEALQLMDHFVQLIERYVPLHDASEGKERAAFQTKLVASLKRLDEALALILSRSELSTDGFETATRFIELRYAESSEDEFHLSSV